MPEHYPKATVMVTVWCRVCRAETRHRVDDRRRGPCLECLEKRTREAALRRLQAKQSEQGGLFDDREKYHG